MAVATTMGQKSGHMFFSVVCFCPNSEARNAKAAIKYQKIERCFKHSSEELNF
jgi:hypothetical protein